MVKTTTSNVGIGTTSPSQKLDVNGNINATGFVDSNRFSHGSASIANNATATVGYFQGGALLIVSRDYGNSALFFVTAYGGITMLCNSANGYSTTQGTSDKSNVYASGSPYPTIYIENKIGSTYGHRWTIVGEIP